MFFFMKIRFLLNQYYSLHCRLTLVPWWPREDAPKRVQRGWMNYECDWFETWYNQQKWKKVRSFHWNCINLYSLSRVLQLPISWKLLKTWLDSFFPKYIYKARIIRKRKERKTLFMLKTNYSWSQYSISFSTTFKNG